MRRHHTWSAFDHPRLVYIVSVTKTAGCSLGWWLVALASPRQDPRPSIVVCSRSPMKSIQTPPDVYCWAGNGIKLV